VCSLIGAEFIHSVEEEGDLLYVQVRELLNASQTIQVNNMIERKDTKDPKEDTIFHVVNESG